MILQEAALAQLVGELSKQQSPQFVPDTVAEYMKRQPVAGQYVASHQRELGVEGVVLVLLHAAILTKAVERAAGRRLRRLGSPSLDSAARMVKADDAFEKAQPAAHDYLVANVADDDTLQTPAHKTLALYLVRVLVQAALDRV